MKLTNFLISPTNKYEDALKVFIENDVNFETLINKGYPKVNFFLEKNSLV